jgi:hypothetical protein
MVAARLVTGGVCVCVCVWVGGWVWCLLELIAKAMTPHSSGSGRCIGNEWARHSVPLAINTTHPVSLE